MLLNRELSAKTRLPSAHAEQHHFVGIRALAIRPRFLLPGSFPGFLSLKRPAGFASSFGHA
jgi:hypothetical protein